MSLPRATLAKYITSQTHFVETGTKWGDTCVRARDLGAVFVATCERDMLQHTMAWLHLNDAFRGDGFFCREGESIEFLRDYALTCYRSGPIVVFLDAHTDSESPVCEELCRMREWSKPPDTILIDDVRLFRSKQWGVSLDQVVAAVADCGDYAISFDTGIEAEDVLVAQRRG